MRASVAFVCALSAGCNLDFQAQKDLPSGLARRIDQKRAEVASQPKNAQLSFELGQLYLEGERWFEAADALLAAKNNGLSDEARVMGALATAYMSLGYYSRVEALLRDCFQKNRNEPGCLYAAGALMMLVGTKPALDAARNVWSNLVAVAPDHPKANYVRSQLDQLNATLGPPGAPPAGPASGPSSRPADGARGTPQGELPPNHPPAPGAAAAVPGHPSAGGSPPAIPGHAEAGGRGAPPAIPGHAGASGDRNVGKLNPFGVAIQKAMVAVRDNDPVAAERAYREALQIRPDDASALAGLAESLYAQQRYDDAVATIEKAWSIDPQDPQVRWIFGLVMLQARKRVDEAIGAWQALSRDNPDYARQLDLERRLQAVKQTATP